jgi:hypothetical protein
MLAANVAHDLGHGVVGAAVAAWPAVALVGWYELLMLAIQGAQRPAGEVTAETTAVVSEALRARAFEEFAEGIADGRVPSIRTIRATLHMGQSRGQLVRTYLATLRAGQGGDMARDVRVHAVHRALAEVSGVA